MLAATDWAGIALVITAAGSCVGALGAFVVTLRRLGTIEDAVHTSDGRQIGELVEQNFGSRAAGVPEGDRTATEQRAVQLLSPEDRATPGEGHPQEPPT